MAPLTKKTPASAPASAPAAAASTSPPVVVTPVGPTPTPATTPVVVVAPIEEDSFQVKFDALTTDLASIAAIIKNLQLSTKVMLKEYNKAQKNGNKRGRKNGVPGVKRTPSGFAKPTLLSDDLCDFLGIAHGSERARMDVTRLLNAYIKEHNLQDPTDKRKIIPDAKINGIMNLKPGDNLSYFNMQTFIKHHFIKVVPVAVPVAV